MKTANHNLQKCNCPRCSFYTLKILSPPNKEIKNFWHLPSYLMTGSVRNVVLEKHPARFSVRWVRRGQYVYEVEGERLVLTPGNYLILNNNSKYNSATASDVTIENFTVSFDPTVLPGVFQALTQKDEWLLDNPFELNDKGETRFLVNTYKVEGEIERLFARFAQESTKSTGTTALDESFYQLVKQLLLDQKKIKREAAQIAGAKKSTKEELYRRVSRARDYIRAHAMEELRVETIAAEAGMSPYHFLRTYKQAFKITPHQELLNIRLVKARELMSAAKNQFSLARIALDAGFNDLSSFSKAFKQQYGTAPSRFDALAKASAKNLQI